MTPFPLPFTCNSCPAFESTDPAEIYDHLRGCPPPTPCTPDAVDPETVISDGLTQI